MSNELVKICESIARDAHQGQFRRDGVTPYITHPQAVADLCRTDDEKAVAWLHDTLEDCDITALDLYVLHVPRHIIDAVYAMTKRDGEAYEEYLARVKDNPLALSVKINDITANLADQPTQKQIEKYGKAMKFLLS